MKNLRPLLIAPCILAFQLSSAQTASHLTLSDDKPTAGEKLTLTYNAEGSLLDGKAIKAFVYYLDEKDFPVADVDLKADGKVFKGETTVPAAAKAFFVKISSDRIIDGNDGSGYMYAVYKDGKPVEGAYAQEANATVNGIGTYYGGIKRDNDKAASLLKQEFANYPASEKEYGATYTSLLLTSTKPEDLAFVNKKIVELEASSDEKDLMQASNILARLRRKTSTDSLSAIIRQKFPNGQLVQNEAGMAFAREKDLPKKDSLYQAYIAKYPEKKDGKATIQENFRMQLASAYLAKGDVAGYEKYAAEVKDKYNLAGALNNVAYEWAKKGEKLPEAEKFSKQSLDIVQSNIDNPKPRAFASVSEVRDGAKATWDMYADTYAYILCKEGKYAEAAKYQQGVYERSGKDDPEINQHYAEILIGLKEYKKSQEVLEATLKAGKNYEGIKDDLKKDYVGTKGSDKGFDEYLASLNNAAQNKLQADLAKQLINQPSPLFTLKDLDGKTVSLADLKGKTVIVDFWATWCGPCKASFPGMQMAVNKYKDNPNVKFLFVDTWENAENYADGVKKFIADNKYTFHVLLDEKDESGRQQKIVSQFKVEGIPTKFIIDKTGNIRFKVVGFSGSAEQLVDEVSTMIDMAGNPDAMTAAPKVSMNK